MLSGSFTFRKLYNIFKPQFQHLYNGGAHLPCLLVRLAKNRGKMVNPKSLVGAVDTFRGPGINFDCFGDQEVLSELQSVLYIFPLPQLQVFLFHL